MMRILVTMLKQRAVYWGSPVQDGYGKFTFATPTEIRVRWEKKQEMFIDPQGDEVMSMAIVYTASDVDIGGYLYLGVEADLASDHSDPQVIGGAFKIKQFGKLPTLPGTQYLRTAWL
jgi:hypothetical protein